MALIGSPLAAGHNDDVTSRIHAVQWRDDGLIAFKLSGGRVAGGEAPAGLEKLGDHFSVVEYRPWQRRMIFKFRDGYGFESELGSASNKAPVRGRPVVYLDQNQWSTMSKSLFAPQRVADPAERLAAVQLLTMAEANRVILPMSAAHLSETGAWSNTIGRLELAKTILAGSRGWQMRDALVVRADEFRGAIAMSAGLTSVGFRPVMTLEPYAALDTNFRGSDSEVRLPPEVPESWRAGYESTLSNVVYVACLLDREPTPRGSLEGWLHRVQEFSSWLESERQRSKTARRRSARLFAAADAMKEIASAAADVGATPQQMTAWFAQRWDADDLGPPAVTFFRSVMVDKMLAGARWEQNDLTDLMYLCTAAGYADHVVGERRTVSLLGQTVRRLGAPVKLHTKLESVVEALRSEVGNITS